MITIPNTKGVTADVFYATLKSTFTDYMNMELRNDQVFEFTLVDDTVLINQPEISEEEIYTLVFTDTVVMVSKNQEIYDTPVLEERLMAFIHIAVD